MRTTVYLTPKQRDIINRLMPNRMSSLLRDVIDIIIDNDSFIHPEDFKNDPEVLGLLYEYRRYLQQSHDTYVNRENLRRELYKYFDDMRIPFQCSKKNGHKRALKACRDLIPEFRLKGYYISDRVAENMIVDYVHMIHDTGRDDSEWQNYQTLHPDGINHEIEG